MPSHGVGRVGSQANKGFQRNGNQERVEQAGVGEKRRGRGGGTRPGANGTAGGVLKAHLTAGEVQAGLKVRLVGLELSNFNDFNDLCM